MNNFNYERVVDKISRTSALEIDEVKRRIEAKRAKLSNLISHEGAAQIVAAELGISFENEKLKINELLPGMRKVGITGKIIELFPVRTYKNKKGENSKVVNMLIADEVSNIKVVLWDTNHISFIEEKKIGVGDSVEINNASMRGNELHLGSFSEFRKTNEIFDRVVTEKNVMEKNISDFTISDNVKTRAFIVQSFEPRFFYLCPECNKKVSTDGENYVCIEHGKILPNKRALMNVVLDDGTDTIRAVFFGETLSLAGITEFENQERLISQRQDLIGKEMIFCGQIRNNKFFNELEFIVETVAPINIDFIIESLEKKN